MSSLPAPSAGPGAVRTAVSLGVLGLAVAAGAGLAARADPGKIPAPLDYYQYWSAGWLIARGENPYDLARLREVQAAGGMPHDLPAPTWHPPWTLAVALPFGLLPIRAGWLAWMVLQAAAVVAAADLLFRAAGAGDRRRVGWALAAGWAPTAYLIGAGQITGLCLLGVAGFAAGMRAGRPGLAGAAAALTAIKPHLLAVFGLALLLEATRDRAARKAVLAGGLALAAAGAVVVALNPAAPGQYLDILLDRNGTNPFKIQDVPSPTLGYHLRAAVAPGSFAVALIPLAVAAGATVVAWWAGRRAWDWNRAIPWLVVGSMLAACYGAWSYDLVLLLAPILLTAARLTTDPAAGPAARRLAAGWYAAVTAGLFACLAMTGEVVETDFVVVTPVVAGGVLLTGWAAGWWRPGRNAANSDAAVAGRGLRGASAHPTASGAT